MSEENRVTVTDVEMPFGSMVAFMVKWTFATIPALIIVAAICALIVVVFGGGLVALGGMLK
jgi:hypothetical protein